MLSLWINKEGTMRNPEAIENHAQDSQKIWNSFANY